MAGSLSNICASLVRFIVPATVAAGMYLLLGGSLSILDFAGFLVLATKLVEAELMMVASISALRGMAPSGRRLDAVMTTPEPTGEAEIQYGTRMPLKTCLSGMGRKRMCFGMSPLKRPPVLLPRWWGLREAENPRCFGSWPGFGIIRRGISAWRGRICGKSGRTAC